MTKQGGHIDLTDPKTGQCSLGAFGGIARRGDKREHYENEDMYPQTHRHSLYG